MSHHAQDLVRRLIGAINNQDNEALPDLVGEPFGHRRLKTQLV